MTVERKGSAMNGFVVLVLGLVMLTLPLVFQQGIDDFGLASSTGLGLAAEFPPWENRTDEETNINYTDNSIAIVDGEGSATYRTIELTNEPDNFRLIQLGYNSTIPLSDSSVTVNVTAYESGQAGSYESQVVSLTNGTGTIDVEERLVGSRLQVQVDLTRTTQNDPTPELHNLSVSVKTIDSSQVSTYWQKLLILAVIGFTVVVIVSLPE